MPKPPMWQPIIEQQRQEMFIGRRDQLLTFTDNFVNEIPKYMIFAITGEGGVGKSELLRQFTGLTTSAGIGGIVIGLDDRYLSPVTVMGHIAEELAKLGIAHEPFDKRYKEYRRLQQEVESDEKAPRSVINLVARGLSDFTVKNLRKAPGVGVFFESIDEKTTGDALAEFVNYSVSRFTNKDEVQLLREPERILTPLFLALLAQVCESRRLVLMFDVFERTCEMLESWLLSLLKFDYGGFNVYLTFVISGRDPLDQHWTYFTGSLCRMPLEPFTLDETKQYLNTRGISHEELASQIYDTTAGLPVLVELLAATKPQPGIPLADISKDAVERFLLWTPQEDRRQIALLAAAPRQFNRDILSAALGGDATTPFNWLTAQSYMRTTQERGWFYHEKVRELMLRYLHQTTPHELEAVHLRLSEFFETQQTALGLTGMMTFASDTWCAYEAERVYHALSARPEQNISIAATSFLRIFRQRLPKTQTIVGVCRQIAHETSLNAIKNLAATLAEAYLAYDRDDYAQVVEQLSIVADSTELDTEARCCLYARRGEMYRLMRKYDRALIDFDRVIELDEKDAWAYAMRGMTYNNINKHDESLTDLTHAIDLDDQQASAFTRRGETYLDMKRYVEALADFTHALELDSSHLRAYAMRGVTFRHMSKFDESLADLTHAIELDEKYVWAYTLRGATYEQWGKYDEALADFTRVIEISSEKSSAYSRRSQTLILVGAPRQYIVEF